MPEFVAGVRNGTQLYTDIYDVVTAQERTDGFDHPPFTEIKLSFPIS